MRPERGTSFRSALVHEVADVMPWERAAVDSVAHHGWLTSASRVDVVEVWLKDANRITVLAERRDPTLARCRGSASRPLEAFEKPLAG